MADSSGEKTEEATPQKLQQARRKGQVAQSKDLAAAAVLVSAFAVMSFQAAGLAMDHVERAGRTWALAVQQELARQWTDAGIDVELSVVDPFAQTATLLVGWGITLALPTTFTSAPAPTTSEANRSSSCASLVPFSSFTPSR